MNTISQTNSYAQLMQAINTARQRNSGLATPVAQNAPVAKKAAVSTIDIRSMQQAKPLVPVASMTAMSAPKTPGRILGNYFDAYA